MTSPIVESRRELHSRTTDSLHVRLLWHEALDFLAVAVNDARSGESFAIDVRDGERPVHVFEHPFAYQALRSAA